MELSDISGITVFSNFSSSLRGKAPRLSTSSLSRSSNTGSSVLSHENSLLKASLKAPEGLEAALKANFP